MLRQLSIGVLSIALLAGGSVALAAVRGHHTHVNCLDAVWRTNRASTTSTTFVPIPGLADLPASIFPITVTMSAVVSGAPVEFRVRSTNVGAQTSTSRPGRVRFVPAVGGDAFSFQWIEPDGSAAVHVNDLVVEWRSPSGQLVSIDRADMSVAYQTETGACTAA